jgi:hypothetical protein
MDDTSVGAEATTIRRVEHLRAGYVYKIDIYFISQMAALPTVKRPVE